MAYLFVALASVILGALIESKFNLLSAGESETNKLYKELIDFSKGLHDRVLALEEQVNSNVSKL